MSKNNFQDNVQKKVKAQLILLSLLLFGILLLVMPLSSSLIDIVIIDGNNVNISAKYTFNATLIDANLTNSSGYALYRLKSDGSSVANMGFDKFSPSDGYLFAFVRLPDGTPFFTLPEGTYTFSLTSRNVFGSSIADSQPFTIDLTPCNNNNIFEPPAEQCDGTNITNTSCKSYIAPQGGSPFSAGTLTCSDCSLNTTTCTLCLPGYCDVCNDQLCASDGKSWTQTNYTLLCGATDSNSDSSYEDCTAGVCDVSAKKFCTSANSWTSTGFCSNCSLKASSCAKSCTAGTCDVDTNKYCNNTGKWEALDLTDYCYVCGDYDANCSALETCSGSNCDVQKNMYCDDSVWSAVDYCAHCGAKDADCGVPSCTHGSCDTCPEAQKYCNQGVWESENYCDANRCGKKDPLCNRGDCVHGICDASNHKYCAYGYWSSDSQLFCNNCQDEIDSSLDSYCVNIQNCGNKIIDYGEFCDGTNLNGMNCSQRGFESGTLRCNSACSFNTSGCVASASCGNGISDPDEVCDFNSSEWKNGKGISCTSYNPDLYSGGTLRCNSTCSYADSNCTFILPPPTCNDGVKNNESNEDCDGADLGGASCSSLGYASGVLACNDDCSFDTLNCVVNSTSKLCGDGIIQQPNGAGFYEQCDGTNYSGKQCSDFGGYTGGYLSCTGLCSLNYDKCTGAKAICGDDVHNNLSSEDCDGTDLGGYTCKSFGFTSGELSCTSNCKFDKVDCVKNSSSYVCGDNIVTHPNSADFNEQCDGTNLEGREDTQCVGLDEYFGGTLSCFGYCAFNYNKCIKTGTCGDGAVNNKGEFCDKDDLAGKTNCDQLPGTDFSSGKLSCRTDCQYNTSKCKSPANCSNGVLESDEDCDGNVINSSCSSLNRLYTNGTLSCTSDCRINISLCFTNKTTPIIPNSTCSNKILNVNETDVDCGGLQCSPCLNGKKCLVNTDCSSNYCKSGVCGTADCTDKIKNGLESDVDCGGGCAACALNKTCNKDTDCVGAGVNAFCHPVTKKCLPAKCGDGYENGDETGTDCGGGCQTKCKANDGCVTDTDCSSGLKCTANICSTDKTVDTDEDGMPDYWEEQYNLDPNDPDDAAQDADGDGVSNLDEFLNITDPTQADNESSSENGNPLSLILLIIGLLFMIGSAGFLVYSRKVLVPRQRAAAQSMARQPNVSQQQGGLAQRQQQFGSSLTQGRPFANRPVSSSGTPIARSRLSERLAARKNLLKGFGQSKDQSRLGESKDSVKKGAGEKKDDGFVALSSLDKKSQPDKASGSKLSEKIKGGESSKSEPPKTGDIFQKLKAFSQSYRNKEADEKDNDEKKKQVNSGEDEKK